MTHKTWPRALSAFIKIMQCYGGLMEVAKLEIMKFYELKVIVGVVGNCSCYADVMEKFAHFPFLSGINELNDLHFFNSVAISIILRFPVKLKLSECIV